ncbi:MAG: glycosyltransferase [Planctomycetes bacterium]|nr:glycosyltransferase [Planctomycetota bacterium]
MKVAIAHDFIRHGGAEKVLEQLHRIWPEAPVHTLLDERGPLTEGWDVRPSWLQGLVPPRYYRWPLPLYPGMVDRLRVDPGIDLLVTSSVSWMKSLRAPAGVPHLCYIYRPMMFGYERQDVFLASYPRPLRPLLRALVGRIRRWDQAHADEPDLYVGCSRYIAELVRKHYRREAEVLYPPVRLEPFLEAGRRVAPGEYFLTALRLESYKRVGIAVEACTRLGLPLKVAGRGPELERLRSMAGPTVEFVGFVPDEALVDLVAGCRAFLFPSEEDFGIAPVEAMAAGRPVVALGRGGPAETVEEGRSGTLFQDQTADSVIAAIRRLDQLDLDPAWIRDSTARYSEQAFRDGFRRLAERVVAAGPRRRLD